MAIVWNGNHGQLIVDGEVLREYEITGNASMANMSLVASNGKVLCRNEWSVRIIELTAENDANELVSYLRYLNQSTPDYSGIDWVYDDDCSDMDWHEGHPSHYGDW